MALHLTRHAAGVPPLTVPRTAFVLQLARQLLLVGLAALAYFGVRGLTQGAVPSALANARRVVGAERALLLDWEQAIQRAIVDTSWLVTLANWIYIYGHWPVLAAALAWLFARHRDGYFTLRNAMFISGAIGIVIFVLFPTAPPRLAQMGLIDTVTERSSSYRALQPPGLLNKYAAVPSLHFGWNLLVGVIMWRVAGHWALRVAAIVLPIAMAFAVVATANHYVIDVLAGGVVALLGLWLVRFVDPVTRRIAGGSDG